ncbi:hypothetical protein [Bradyrhizobium sp. USDA 4350]
MTAIDLFGPGINAGGVTTRPTDGRSLGAADTWFRDCTDDLTDDGTEYQAAFFNAFLGMARAIARGNGQTAASADVVPQSSVDDAILLKAMQYLIQRGQTVYGADTGTADAMVVALSPAAPEYKNGMIFWMKKGNAANVSTTPTANVNGLGPKTITRRDGQALAKGDLPANAWLPYAYDLASDQLRVVTPVASDYRVLVPYGDPTLWVRTDGNDATADGSANDAAHAFATIQAAITYSSQVWSLGGKKLNIQLGNAGTYTGFVSAQNPVTNVIITGDVNNPGNYVIAAPGTGSGSQIVYCGGASLSLNGVTVTTARADLNFILASYGGTISLNKVVVTAGATTPYFALTGVAGGSINIGGAVTINGNFGGALYAAGGTATMQVGSVVTINASTFSIATLYANGSGGNISILGTWAGTATGSRGYAVMNGTIQQNGSSTTPGTSAPTTASGGQVA